MAATLPLTTSDISLMLRSGYSVPTIEAELATRHFADQLDEGKRNQLIKAGATTELLDAIKSGNLSVPKDELEKSRRKMDEQAAERALMAERAKRNDTLYQNQLLKQRARVVAHGSTDGIAGAAKGNLVRLQNGNLVSCYDEELAPKQIYGLYFSAHWCPPCRKFTPQLVAYYNQIAHDHPEFEIIFVSADKSAEDWNDSSFENRMQLVLRVRQTFAHQRSRASMFFIGDDAATRIDLSRADIAFIENRGEQCARENLTKGNEVVLKCFALGRSLCEQFEQFGNLICSTS